MSKVNVVVRLEKDRHADMGRVAEELKNKGMDVQDQLQILGRITGTVDESDIKNLEDVPGVAKVAPERAFTI
jgi:hypothetical protein